MKNHADNCAELGHRCLDHVNALYGSLVKSEWFLDEALLECFFQILDLSVDIFDLLALKAIAVCLVLSHGSISLLLAALKNLVQGRDYLVPTVIGRHDWLQVAFLLVVDDEVSEPFGSLYDFLNLI